MQHPRTPGAGISGAQISLGSDDAPFTSSGPAAQRSPEAAAHGTSNDRQGREIAAHAVQVANGVRRGLVHPIIVRMFVRDAERRLRRAAVQ